MSLPTDSDVHDDFLRRFAKHEPAIRAFVRRLVPTRGDADDVMQEVSVLLWKKYASFDTGGDFRAWAVGVARLEALAWLRDRRRDRLVLDERVVDRLAEESEAAEGRLQRQRDALEFCMEKVHPRHRSLLMRAYGPDARIKEIAAESGRSTGAFYQWLHRTRRALLDCVRGELTRRVST